jgi:hypothetical protein
MKKTVAEISHEYSVTVFFLLRSYFFCTFVSSLKPSINLTAPLTQG